MEHKEVYYRHNYLFGGRKLKDRETGIFHKDLAEMTDSEAAYSLKNLSAYLSPLW